MILGAVEGGGTKFVCAVGTGIDDIHRRTTIPTTTPAETLARVAEFLEGVDAIGLAMFGPLDLANGRTFRTPKEGWSDVAIGEVVSHLSGNQKVRVVLETDVNAAAVAEAAASAVDALAYITVGTGVGVGVVLDGRPVHGRMHPELGHLLVGGDTFAGVCPFHGACVEGLASAPAIRARTGRAPETLGADDPAWEPTLDALAQLVAACVLAYAPSRIVVGGGVLHARHLLPRLRAKASQRLGGYSPIVPAGDLSQYVVAPHHGDDAGLAGAFLLAARAAVSAT